MDSECRLAAYCHLDAFASKAHLTGELLEIYLLNRASAEQVCYVQEHLLVCTPCRDRLNEARDFVQAIRGGLFRTTGAIAVHRTEDGPVTLFLQPEGDTWLARILGASVDAGQVVVSHSEGVDWCRKAFGELFRGHVCTSRCSSRDDQESG